jgi:CRISPR/Cas system-associated exonuclease Cas4 (RecB family)
MNFQEEFLSYSRISTFLRCRKLYGYQYLQRLKPKREKNYLHKGILIHKGLEYALRAMHRGDTDNLISESIRGIENEYEKFLERAEVQLFSDIPEYKEELQVSCTESIAITKRAIRNLELEKGRWKTLEINGTPIIEYRIEVPLPGWKGFVGYIDWAAEDTTTGCKWLIDFKTKKVLHAEENEEINLQAAIYQYLLEKMGLVLNGSGSYQIKSEIPEIPATLKNGEISKALISTDWETYSAEVLRCNLSLEKYIDVKNKLKSFDKLTVNYRTSNEVEKIWQEILAISQDIRYSELPIYRNINPLNCKSCAYHDLCFAELRGNDTQYIEQNFFTREIYR